MNKRAACALLALMVVGCTANAATPGSGLLPMPSATPSPIVRSAAPTPVVLATNTPSPTPVTYVVQKGDTLLGIALKYGVSVDDLQSANGNVPAEYLSIGMTLIIPPPEGGTPVVISSVPTPTAVPVDLSGPACFPTASGALYCFVAAHNPGATALENVAARVILADKDGLPLAGETAISALEVIPPGGTAPLAVLFTAAPAGVAAAVAQLESALPSLNSSSVVLEIQNQKGAPAAGQWTMTGQVHNPTLQSLATVQLTLTLFDSSGAVLGYRQADLPGGMGGGETKDFSISAAPLGGKVFNLTVVAEGKP